MQDKHFKGVGMTRRLWPYRVLIIGIIGLLAYSISYPIIKWCGSETVLTIFLKELGVALVISMVVAFILERLLHESLLLDVHNALNTMREGSDVLEGASELQIEDILSRRELGTIKRWEDKIRVELDRQFSKKSGEICIACVAAPEFFRQGTEIGTVIWEGMTNQQNNCILLCPDSSWADIRADLEPGHPTKMDIKASASYLHNLVKKTGKKVNYNCYDFPPTAFLVITDELLFLEAYPMVKVEIGEGPIGGKTPIIAVRKDSATYDRWKGHFAFIWTKYSTDYESHHP